MTDLAPVDNILDILDIQCDQPPLQEINIPIVPESNSTKIILQEETLVGLLFNAVNLLQHPLLKLRSLQFHSVSLHLSPSDTSTCTATLTKIESLPVYCDKVSEHSTSPVSVPGANISVEYQLVATLPKIQHHLSVIDYIYTRHLDAPPTIELLRILSASPT
jgi:hypothetical protein